MQKLNLTVLAQDFSICKVNEFSPKALQGDIWFAAQTDEELSLVCPIDHAPADAIERSDGWRAMRIDGVLDFSLVGILAGITAVLAGAQIGVFALSTYNTDYILVKANDLAGAIVALEGAGYALRL